MLRRGLPGWTGQSLKQGGRVVEHHTEAFVGVPCVRSYGDRSQFERATFRRCLQSSLEDCRARRRDGRIARSTIRCPSWPAPKVLGDCRGPNSQLLRLLGYGSLLCPRIWLHRQLTISNHRRWPIPMEVRPHAAVAQKRRQQISFLGRKVVAAMAMLLRRIGCVNAEIDFCNSHRDDVRRGISAGLLHARPPED